VNGAADLRVTPLKNCEFHQNWCSDNHDLLKRVNLILLCFIRFFFLMKFVPEDVHGTLLSGDEFCENLALCKPYFV
jgi:hypothetical protein